MAETRTAEELALLNELKDEIIGHMVAVNNAMVKVRQLKCGCILVEVDGRYLLSMKMILA